MDASVKKQGVCRNEATRQQIHKFLSPFARMAPRAYSDNEKIGKHSRGFFKQKVQ